MTRKELSDQIRRSEIFSQWHWFHYHFANELDGRGHPLARGFIDCALECEARMPGYAEALVQRVASISGRPKHLPDWEQLLSILAELFVVAQISRSTWPEETRFLREPKAPASDRNPEILIDVGDAQFAYEVKAPALFAHQQQRATNAAQIVSRYVDRATMSSLVGEEKDVTWPRDNPVKDFLISAEQKFKPFADASDQFVGILVVCWDDFVYEPISALDHPASGLLTPKSFYQEGGKAVVFPSVSGVVVVRHLHQFVRACQDRKLADGLGSPFDYGRLREFPWKTFHPNPAGRLVPTSAIECLDASLPRAQMGAEYSPKEHIWWLE